MKNIAFIILVASLSAVQTGYSQSKQWTEADRKYLYDNLLRSREDLVRETQNLSEKQSRFKESAERWSINEVVEHLAIYEILFQREISIALQGKPQPEIQAKPDSTFFNFIMEKKPHVSVEYSKPFKFSLPTGRNNLKDNIAWFLSLRNESLEYVRTTSDDLRVYYLTPDRPNIHQTLIYAFGHVDRALRQIKKIKQHPSYPK